MGTKKRGYIHITSNIRTKMLARRVEWQIIINIKWMTSISYIICNLLNTEFQNFMFCSPCILCKLVEGKPTWCTKFLNYIYLSITLYMFQALYAHHQESSNCTNTTSALVNWPLVSSLAVLTRYIAKTEGQVQRLCWCNSSSPDDGHIVPETCRE
jgi:hypothetical protein